MKKLLLILFVLISGLCNAQVTPTTLNFKFWRDALDTNTFIFSSGNVIEQSINKASVGTTFSELVTNGTFASNVTGWTGSNATLAWDTGRMKVANTAAQFGYSTQTLATVAGLQYRVKASAVGGTSASCKLQIKDGATQIVNITGTGTTFDFDVAFIALSTSVDIRVLNDNVNGSTMLWDNISVVRIDSDLQTIISKQPLLIQNAVNGKPAVLYDGVDDFMECKLKYVGTNYTKFITFVFDVSTSNTGYLIGCGTNASHSLNIKKASSTTAVITGSSSEGITYTIKTIDCSNAITIIECVDVNGNKELYINGVLVDVSSTVRTHTDLSWRVGTHSTGATANCYKGYQTDYGVTDFKLTATEVYGLDEHQRLRWRVPSDKDDYLTVSVASQSGGVGYATTASDAIADTNGFNYIPSINHVRNINDKSGEGYSLSSNGSYYPPMGAKLATLGKKMIFVSNGKAATSIDSVSSSNPSDRSLDWGTGSTLRANFFKQTDSMLSVFDRDSLDWIQINIGERDVTYMAANPSWTKALFKAGYTNLIDSLAAYYPGVKFLIVQTLQQRNTSTDVVMNTTYWTWVKEAEQEIVGSRGDCFLDDSNKTFTITNGKVNSSDGIHVSKTGNVEQGESIAVIMYNN